MDSEKFKPINTDWNKPIFNEEAFENSILMKMINGKISPPYWEADDETPTWNPNNLYKSELTVDRSGRFIPGHHIMPAFPVISALTVQQHCQAMRVLSYKSGNVQPINFEHPSKQDYEVLKQIHNAYEGEKKEFLKWAKILWMNGDCFRALRPNLDLEKIYDADFKLRAFEVKSWPQNYVLVTQIQLETNDAGFVFEFNSDLIRERTYLMARADYPSIMYSPIKLVETACPMPEPCLEHPYRFMLPFEDDINLPMTEVHKNLADIAIMNGTRCILSENAMRCLMEIDRKWTITVSAIKPIDEGASLTRQTLEELAADFKEGREIKSNLVHNFLEVGDFDNVLVLGSEFGVQKECASRRIYRAYKHLLYRTFAPTLYAKSEDKDEPSEPYRFSDESEKESDGEESGDDESSNESNESIEEQTSEDSSGTITGSSSPDQPIDASLDLVNELDKMDIDVNPDSGATTPETPQNSDSEATTPEMPQEVDANESMSTTDEDSSNEFKIHYNPNLENEPPAFDMHYYDKCTCKDTQFKDPSERSFHKWRISNTVTKMDYFFVVHASHKLLSKRDDTEILLEPIVEYQPELGGTMLSEAKIRSLFVSLMLRRSVKLVTVRVKHDDGEVLVIDELTKEDFIAQHGDQTAKVADTLHTVINRMRYLRPGNYVLAHEPHHGPNAMLYTESGTPIGSAKSNMLSIHREDVEMSQAEEVYMAQTPPNLGPIVLPNHKYRGMLPLAFTPEKKFVRPSKKMMDALIKSNLAEIYVPRKILRAKKRGLMKNLQDQAKAEGEAQAGQSEAQCGQSEAQAGQSEVQGGQSEAQAGQSEAQGGQSEAQAGQSEAQGGQSEAQAGQSEAQGCRSEAQAGQSVAQGGQSEAQGGQSDVHGGQLEAQGGQSEAHGGQSELQGSQSEAQSGQSEGQAGQSEAQAGQSDAQGGQSEAQGGKSEALDKDAQG